jgi:hypothetical protein
MLMISALTGRFEDVAAAAELREETPLQTPATVAHARMATIRRVCFMRAL